MGPSSTHGAGDVPVGEARPDDPNHPVPGRLCECCARAVWIPLCSRPSLNNEHQIYRFPHHPNLLNAVEVRAETEVGSASTADEG